MKDIKYRQNDGTKLKECMAVTEHPNVCLDNQNKFYYKQTKANIYMCPVKFFHEATSSKQSAVKPSDDANNNCYNWENNSDDEFDR